MASIDPVILTACVLFARENWPSQMLHCCPFLRALRRSKGFSTWKTWRVWERIKPPQKATLLKEQTLTDQDTLCSARGQAVWVSLWVYVAPPSLPVCYFMRPWVSDEPSTSLSQWFYLACVWTFLKAFWILKKKRKIRNQNYPKSLVFYIPHSMDKSEIKLTFKKLDNYFISYIR